MSIKIDMAQFREGMHQKVVQIQEASRPAAQAGAQVIYDHARLNAPKSNKPHWFYGTHQKYLFNPLTLLNSIYQVFSKRNSREGLATYHISYNMTECPYAHMVEVGTSKAPAHSFVGKAIADARGDAGDEMKREFIERVQS